MIDDALKQEAMVSEEINGIVKSPGSESGSYHEWETSFECPEHLETIRRRIPVHIALQEACRVD